MQKKIFSGFLVLVIVGTFSCVSAKTVEVLSQSTFSTENPPSVINVELLSDLEISPETTIPAGAQIQGKLVDVVSPKRLKKDATFSFQPECYIINSTKYNLDGNVKGKYTTTLNKGDLAKKAALGVGNHFVKGLSMGVTAVEGAIKNEEGNPLKSGAKSMYEASPLSYSEKGSEINITENQVFYLKFPDTKE